MVEQLKNFIKDNNLKFTEGSGGDINILGICGYSVYKEASLEECLKAINTTNEKIKAEVTRVYNYAKTNNYGKWWKTENAKKSYKF